MTMVERVARALCTQHYEKRFGPIKGNPHAPHIMMNVEGNWHVFLEPARAAIEAMKEPTPNQIAAAMRVDLSSVDLSASMCLHESDVSEVFDAMIKAALEEGE